MVKIKERLQAIHIKNLTNTKQINTKSTTKSRLIVGSLEDRGLKSVKGKGQRDVMKTHESQ